MSGDLLIGHSGDLLRYGTYVPFYRLKRGLLSSGHGERAVAGHDEDATSLAVEAGRESLRNCNAEPTNVLFASTSHAYDMAPMSLFIA